MGAVGEDLVDGWAREGRTQAFVGKFSEGLVVAVEEPGEIGIEDAVAGEKLAGNEGLEKPGGMRQVPLGWGSLGTGLDHHVLRGERPTNVDAALPDLGVVLAQAGCGRDCQSSHCFVSQRDLSLRVQMIPEV
jgi:hypothetical protein